MLSTYLIVAFLGAIICLDRIAVQTLISRPIVTAPLMGTILGDPLTGLTVGAFTELIWLDRLSIGGYVPPHDTLAAILITAGTIISSRHTGFNYPELIVIGFIIIIPLAYAGKRIEQLIIMFNGKWSIQAEKTVENDRFERIDRLQYLSLIIYFCLFFFFILTVLPLSVEVMIYAGRYLPPTIKESLRLSYWLLPLIGVAVILNVIRTGRALPIVAAIAIGLIMAAELAFP